MSSLLYLILLLQGIGVGQVETSQRRGPGVEHVYSEYQTPIDQKSISVCLHSKQMTSQRQIIGSRKVLRRHSSFYWTPQGATGPVTLFCSIFCVAAQHTCATGTSIRTWVSAELGPLMLWNIPTLKLPHYTPINWKEGDVSHKSSAAIFVTAAKINAISFFFMSFKKTSQCFF
jgi:hypothetical protein